MYPPWILALKIDAEYNATQGLLFVKNPPANAGDVGDAGSIPGLGRFPGWENGNQLQCACLENSMDSGALWTAIHGVAKSQAGLSEHAHSTLLGRQRLNLKCGIL